MRSDQRNSESSSAVSFWRLWAMTKEKVLINALPSSVRRRSLMSLMTASPSTLSLSSRRRGTASCARDLPMLEGPARKKLLPASAGDATAVSRMVKWPMPGRTRFLRTAVAVADEERTRMREDSRAFWPDAAQSLQTIWMRHYSVEGGVAGTDRSWRSYRLVLLSGGLRVCVRVG